jgi:RNA polymerase sigma factor (sigma-70 family)
MRNILSDDYQGLRLPKKLQLQRVKKVITEELSPKQRETLLAYYFRSMTVTQIALEQGVNKSTVSRTLRRGEERIRRYLKY